MKRKGYKIILVWILVLADLAATAVLAVGVNMGDEKRLFQRDVGGYPPGKVLAGVSAV